MRRTLRIVNDLRVNMTASAVHGKTRTSSNLRPQLGANALTATCKERQFCHYFFFPSLRKIYSPRYLMPLPL